MLILCARISVVCVTRADCGQVRSCQIPLFINEDTHVRMNGAVMDPTMLRDWEAYQDAITARANE